MTQLLLFDAPAPARSPFPVPVESPAGGTDRSKREVKEPQRMRRLPSKAEASRDRQPNPKERDPAKELTPPRGGMHRMGDLASLVIARYELVAKRRAALLARGPLPSVRF